MATSPIPSTSTTMPTSRRSKQNRARPNLSKICGKTKMCSFHVRGLCQRAESCSFAHDQSEIQAKPDLGCTKLCPALLSGGHCPHINRCKFAHSTAELRRIDVEEFDMHPAAAVASEPCAPPSVDERQLTTCSELREQGGLETTEAVRQVPQTAPEVTSCLKDATVSGALTLGGMIFHLNRIFLAVYQARPEVAHRVGVTADVLATVTAKETWADAGLDGSSLLSFNDFARLCALPVELMPRDMPQPVSLVTPSSKLQQAVRSNASTKDSDSWSQCSTDDGKSDGSVRMNPGWQTPSSCDDWEDAACEPKMEIVNTFIHFSTPSIATRTKRAHSVPSPVVRAA